MSRTRPRQPARDEAWKEHAACRGMGPDLFYAEPWTEGGAVKVRSAKAVCGRCPVQDECLTFALAIEPTTVTSRDGVWAGMTESERQRWVREHGKAGA